MEYIEIFAQITITKSISKGNHFVIAQKLKLKIKNKESIKNYLFLYAKMF